MSENSDTLARHRWPAASASHTLSLMFRLSRSVLPREDHCSLQAVRGVRSSHPSIPTPAVLLPSMFCRTRSQMLRVPLQGALCSERNDSLFYFVFRFLGLSRFPLLPLSPQSSPRQNQALTPCSFKHHSCDRMLVGGCACGWRDPCRSISRTPRRDKVVSESPNAGEREGSSV